MSRLPRVVLKFIYVTWYLEGGYKPYAQAASLSLTPLPFPIPWKSSQDTSLATLGYLHTLHSDPVLIQPNRVFKQLTSYKPRKVETGFTIWEKGLAHDREFISNLAETRLKQRDNYFIFRPLGSIADQSKELTNVGFYESGKNIRESNSILLC